MSRIPTKVLPPEPFALSVKDARPLLGNRSFSSIYEMLNRGELEAVKDGKRTLITLSSIRARQEALPKATFGPPTPRRGPNAQAES
jgi:hypothetical protein